MISFLHDTILYEKVLFFETPREKLTYKDDRVYSVEFERSKVRHIGWELSMQSPRIRTPLSYIIKWQITKPDNKITPKYFTEFNFKEGWYNPWVAGSWGDKNFGKLKTGLHKIEFEIKNKKVFEGKFNIK